MAVLQWQYDLRERGRGGSSELTWLISGTRESLFICCGQRRIGYRICALQLVKYLGISPSDPHSSTNALHMYLYMLVYSQLLP